MIECSGHLQETFNEVPPLTAWATKSNIFSVTAMGASPLMASLVIGAASVKSQVECLSKNGSERQRRLEIHHNSHRTWRHMIVHYTNDC